MNFLLSMHQTRAKVISPLLKLCHHRNILYFALIQSCPCDCLLVNLLLNFIRKLVTAIAASNNNQTSGKCAIKVIKSLRNGGSKREIVKKLPVASVLPKIKSEDDFDFVKVFSKMKKPTFTTIYSPISSKSQSIKNSNQTKCHVMKSAVSGQHRVDGANSYSEGNNCSFKHCHTNGIGICDHIENIRKIAIRYHDHRLMLLKVFWLLTLLTAVTALPPVIRIGKYRTNTSYFIICI